MSLKPDKSDFLLDSARIALSASVGALAIVLLGACSTGAAPPGSAQTPTRNDALPQTPPAALLGSAPALAPGSAPSLTPGSAAAAGTNANVNGNGNANTSPSLSPASVSASASASPASASASVSPASVSADAGLAPAKPMPANGGANPAMPPVSAAAASSPTSATSATSATSPTSAELVLRQLAYADRARTLPAAELAQEIARLGNPSAPAGQVQLALLLSQLHQTQDLIRAQELLTRVINNPAPEAQALQPLARLLAARYGEQRRLEDQVDKQAQQLREVQRRLDQTHERLEALKAIERSLTSRPPAPAASAPASRPRRPTAPAP